MAMTNPRKTPQPWRMTHVNVWLRRSPFQNRSILGPPVDRSIISYTSH